MVTDFTLPDFDEVTSTYVKGSISTQPRDVIGFLKPQTKCYGNEEKKTTFPLVGHLNFQLIGNLLFQLWVIYMMASRQFTDSQAINSPMGNLNDKQMALTV